MYKNNNLDISSRILDEVAKHPDGAGLMDIARPLLFDYSETSIRCNIRSLAMKKQIRMEKILDRILLYPVEVEA
jgi:hypothetical protein